jgi:signal transduction histidine kinase
MLSDASEGRRQVYQEALVSEADQLTQLVENILRLNSLESSDLELRARLWNLNDLVIQHQERCQQIAEAHQLAFAIDLGDTLSPVRIDVIWLMDAICRLVDNAVHYTPPGGKITIRTTSVFEDGRHWSTLSVTDTGVGIPDEELLDIFERFYRGDYARDQQISGTGLGLAIVKGVADLHDGHVTVESQVSEGSTFTIWLPVERVQ